MVSLELPCNLWAALVFVRVMRVRLTKKLADVLNGIDLSHCAEGGVIELSDREARLLMAEKWAEPVGENEELTRVPEWPSDRAVAADQGVPGRRHERWRKRPARFVADSPRPSDDNAT
jgi:hypothetical protein